MGVWAGLCAVTRDAHTHTQSRSVYKPEQLCPKVCHRGNRGVREAKPCGCFVKTNLFNGEVWNLSEENSPAGWYSSASALTYCCSSQTHLKILLLLLASIIMSSSAAIVDQNLRLLCIDLKSKPPWNSLKLKLQNYFVLCDYFFCIPAQLTWLRKPTVKLNSLCCVTICLNLKALLKLIHLWFYAYVRQPKRFISRNLEIEADVNTSFKPPSVLNIIY